MWSKNSLKTWGNMYYYYSVNLDSVDEAKILTLQTYNYVFSKMMKLCGKPSAKHTYTHIQTYRETQSDSWGLEIWYITKMAEDMGRERGLTCLPSAIHCNLTIGSLYKLVVLPPAHRGSLCKCYKYTSLVFLLFTYKGCILHQHRSI